MVLQQNLMWRGEGRSRPLGRYRNLKKLRNLGLMKIDVGT